MPSPQLPVPERVLFALCVIALAGLMGFVMAGRVLLW